MANKYGPTRGELWFRIWFSLVGVALMIGIVIVKGVPEGPAAIETFGIGTLFFGGSLVWNLRKLIRKDYPDAL